MENHKYDDYMKGFNVIFIYFLSFHAPRCNIIQARYDFHLILKRRKNHVDTPFFCGKILTLDCTFLYDIGSTRQDLQNELSHEYVALSGFFSCISFGDLDLHGDLDL